jgi:ATP-dependent protease ClpP protease subunit
MNKENTHNDNKQYLASEDDGCNQYKKSDQLSFYRKTKEQVHLSVPIDESFKAPYYYRNACRAIMDLDGGDVLHFEIDSPGGRMDGLIALLSAMQRSGASSTANINGECHSAASMLALSCDNIQVSPYSTMLCHYVTYGTSGKAYDVKQHTQHISKVTEKLFRDTYELFLTEDEIEKCLEGFELWLDADSINARLEYKYNLLNKSIENKSKEASAEEASPVPPKQTPKKQRKLKA